jgi:ParB-like chromosome segregation protein Spo0J
MVHRIDTIEQFEEIRGSLEPVYIISKSHGKIPVPCCNTVLVSTKLVVENQYNPNYVPAEKMKLLMQSIVDNGFCFPVVVIYDDESELFVVIDGFHRTIIGGNGWLEFDYIPLVVLDHDIKRRMAATVQFNKARGVHQVDLDADVIRALIEQGMTEDEICAHLGIDEETVHRYKQLTGIAELFKNADYSMSWEMKEVDDGH